MKRVLPQRMPCGDGLLLRALFLRGWQLAACRLGRILRLRLASHPPQPHCRRSQPPPLQWLQTRGGPFRLRWPVR